MMREKKLICLSVLLTVLLLLLCPPSLADDAELIRELPGTWSYEGELQKDEEEPWDAQILLNLEESGKMSLVLQGEDTVTYTGIWASELVTDGMDRLTLLFTSSDAPADRKKSYRTPSVYTIYSESWIEGDAMVSALLLEPDGELPENPILDFSGWDSLALYRRNHLNMRVVNCSEYVSLREKPSTTSRRIAKVPLGAYVQAYGQTGDFTLCVYESEEQEGYILTKYLEKAE